MSPAITSACEDPSAVAFRSILVAVDFSTSADHALQVAAALARSAGARLVLLHVHEPLVATDPCLRDASPMVIFGLSALESMPPASEAAPLFDSRLESLQQELQRRTGLHCEARVRAGAAAAQIVDAAFEEGVDLIVMGTHGRTGLRRWLMGSVAETVVRHARCPVLTLRLPEAEGCAQQGSFREAGVAARLERS
jgi:universal stress protein A